MTEHEPDVSLKITRSEKTKTVTIYNLAGEERHPGKDLDMLIEATAQLVQKIQTLGIDTVKGMPIIDYVKYAVDKVYQLRVEENQKAQH